jgi:serine/threonine protein kinase
MTETTLTPFAQRLRSCRLLTPAQLEEAFTAAPDDNALAQYLLDKGLLTRFQVRQVRAGSTSLTIGNYVAVDFLGRGGGGVVLKARNRLMPERHVALKTLDVRNLHYTPEILARFRREIDIVSRLEHPNLVRALDVIQTRAHWYLVLEYIPGQDLAAVVKERGPLPIGEAVDYIIQAARGLEYAHERNIVHRDVKPTNLLRTPEGQIKVTDLGLARFVTEDDHDNENKLTMRGACLGTPEFMAPEQAEDARSVGPRSDLYSLGATLFHLLTGEFHIGGSTYLKKLQALLTEAPRRIEEVRPDVPTGLGELLNRLLARQWLERPACAADVITALEPYLGNTDREVVEPLTPKRLAEIVLELLQGKKKLEEVCAQHRLTPEVLASYQQRFVEGGEQALGLPRTNVAATEEIRELHAKIGAQQMEIESLRKQLVRGVIR